MTESKGDNHHFWIGRLADRMPDHKSSLVITDPPYNRNFKYGEGVNDNLPRADYHDLLVDTIDLSYRGHSIRRSDIRTQFKSLT